MGCNFSKEEVDPPPYVRDVSTRLRIDNYLSQGLEFDLIKTQKYRGLLRELDSCQLYFVDDLLTLKDEARCKFLKNLMLDFVPVEDRSEFKFLFEPFCRCTNPDTCELLSR